MWLIFLLFVDWLLRRAVRRIKNKWVSITIVYNLAIAGVASGLLLWSKHTGTQFSEFWHTGLILTAFVTLVQCIRHTGIFEYRRQFRIQD